MRETIPTPVYGRTKGVRNLTLASRIYVLGAAVLVALSVALAATTLWSKPASAHYSSIDPYSDGWGSVNSDYWVYWKNYTRYYYQTVEGTTRWREVAADYDDYGPYFYEVSLSDSSDMDVYDGYYSYSTDYAWYTRGSSKPHNIEYNVYKMDASDMTWYWQYSVATHELGHALGFGDLYDSSTCPEDPNEAGWCDEVSIMYSGQWARWFAEPRIHDYNDYGYNWYY